LVSARRPVPAFACALVLLVVLPATASARSVTLTSPTNGQTFYTGTGGSTGVPYAATRDRSGCFQGVSVWRIERDSPTDTFGYLPVLQTTGEGMSQTLATLVGTYTVRARFLCNNNDWVESPPVTIHVVRANPPAGGGGLAELEAQLRAVCAKERTAIGQLARLARSERDTLPVLEYTERFASRSSIVAGGAALAADSSFTTRPFAKLLKIEANLLKFESNIVKILLRDTRARIAEIEQDIGSWLASYRKTCAKYEAPDTSGAGAQKLRVPGGKPSVLRGKVGAGRLRALAGAQREAYKRFAAPGDDASIRKRARKLAGLVDDNIGLRIALARPALLHHARLAARHLPKRARGDAWTVRYVGKPISKLLMDPALTKAERRLGAVLRAQPIR
jgi:hypothetical protein